jgi:putative transposase
MNGIKVIEKEELVNHRSDALLPVKEKILGMVVETMQGLRSSLEKELAGIPLMVMKAMMDTEIENVAGPKYKHQKDRQYNWWGSNPGSVVLDGQRIKLRVPRAVKTGTTEAYDLKTYSLFHEGKELVKRAYRDLIRGISTRNYKDGVERFIDGYGTSAGTISRKMAQAASEKLKDLMSRRFDDLEIAVLMIDGVHFAEQTIVVASGIDIKGFKHVLGLWQGATENSTVVKNLLEELVERGLSSERKMLIVLDGSKALRKGIEEVLGDDAVIQRCVEHKKRNVVEQLPKKYQDQVRKRMTKAYNMVRHDDAKKELTDLVRELELINPSAARSLEEGMSQRDPFGRGNSHASQARNNRGAPQDFTID